MNVSVIIPTHNRAGYLVEALNSIGQQSLPPYEIIVVDDGSTDGTAEAAARFAPAARYVFQEQTGVAGARNRGLAEAKGDTIAWLDSDDLWEPDFLRTVTAGLADEGIDGVYTGSRFIDGEGELLSPASGIVKVVPPEKLYQELLRDNFIPTPALVVRKRCYEAAGLFDPELHICEDSDMWLRLARQFRLVGIPRPLARIRIHGGNTMVNADRFCDYRLMFVGKRFGPLGERPERETHEKLTAYAYGYRSCGLNYLKVGGEENAWLYLAKAAAILPEIWTEVDLYYELLCGPQPPGRRGEVSAVEVAGRLAEIRQRIEPLWEHSVDNRPSQRRLAFGSMYLAAAMLCDKAGAWGLGRGYMIRAVSWNPRLLSSYLVVRRLLKLTLGKRAARMLRNRRGPEPVNQIDFNENPISVESIPAP